MRSRRASSASSTTLARSARRIAARALAASSTARSRPNRPSNGLNCAIGCGKTLSGCAARASRASSDGRAGADGTVCGCLRGRCPDDLGDAGTKPPFVKQFLYSLPSERHALPLGRVLLVVERDLLPVDHVEPRRDVLRAAVLVLEVVRVLPDVEAEDRDHLGLAAAVHERVVLVGRRVDRKLAVGLDAKPAPARAEAAGRLGGELLLKLVERAKRLVDLGGEGAGRALARRRAHLLPEERGG
mmetsp:Transcript_887/g.2792  ORF Transcript_887/g.2792 Transcript_887/m.2792 type:complete len:243 (+) Transcript_887:1763-2491(+)